MSLFYEMSKDEFGDSGKHLKTFNVVIASVLVVVFLLAAFFALLAFSKQFGRNQRLADERNQTTVNDIQIAQTAQLVKVEEQKAQIRVVQAQGIADSQKIIAGSLTQAYLQYEAIEAQKSEVNSQNHTIIYIPSGSNGVPLVTTVPQD